MAVPKRRTSRSKRNMRRANHDKVVPVQLIACSNCGEPSVPHRACPSCGFYKGKKVVAVAGMGMSGVIVPTMIMSTSEGLSDADSRARRAASVAMSLVTMPCGAMRRSRMPVRSRIHESDVSTILSRSRLVRTTGGKKCPVPRMRLLGSARGGNEK